MKKKRIVIFVSIFISMIFMYGCSSQKPLTKSEIAMDTVCTITIYDDVDEGILDEAFEVIQTWNNKLDAFSDTSVIGQVNAKAGIEAVIVDEEIYALIEKSMDYSKLSDGGFDVSAGPLIDLWAIGEPETKEAPSQTDISNALSKVGYQHVQLNPENHSVFLKKTGMKISLGAVAKGFVAEKVKKLLEDQGVQHAIINLGGSATLIDGKTDSQAFSVGVTDPENPEGNPLGILSLKDTSAVTSGDYQRYFTDSQGKKWHHILDCRTGYPTDNGIRQVTIVCEAPLQADALSTTLFILGEEKAKSYLDNTAGVEGILVLKDGSVYVSKGLDKIYTSQK